LECTLKASLSVFSPDMSRTGGRDASAGIRRIAARLKANFLTPQYVYKTETSAVRPVVREFPSAHHSGTGPTPISTAKVVDVFASTMKILRTASGKQHRSMRKGLMSKCLSKAY
jgi:hypothetical protein